MASWAIVGVCMQSWLQGKLFEDSQDLGCDLLEWSFWRLCGGCHNNEPGLRALVQLGRCAHPRSGLCGQDNAMLRLAQLRFTALLRPAGELNSIWTTWTNSRAGAVSRGSRNGCWADKNNRTTCSLHLNKEWWPLLWSPGARLSTGGCCSPSKEFSSSVWGAASEQWA